MPHPDEGLIHAWLDGELDAAEAARIESLVANDPEWAAAAAEARGLIAASARIVGTLDRVPANVIPKAAAAPRRGGHPWLWRAAAAVVLMAGSAVVLERSGTNELPAPKPARTPVSEPQVAGRAAAADAPPPPAAKVVQRPAPRAPGAVSENKFTPSKKELDASKSIEALRDKDVAAGGELRAKRFDAPPASAPSPVPAPVAESDRAARTVTTAAGAASAAGAAQSALSLQKTTRLPAQCWQQLQPPDSARHLIRLEPGALGDSIRLERLSVRGDTLAAVHGRLTALRVPCPAP